MLNRRVLNVLITMLLLLCALSVKAANDIEQPERVDEQTLQALMDELVARSGYKGIVQVRTGRHNKINNIDAGQHVMLYLDSDLLDAIREPEQIKALLALQLAQYTLAYPVGSKKPLDVSSEAIDQWALSTLNKAGISPQALSSLIEPMADKDAKNKSMWKGIANVGVPASKRYTIIGYAPAATVVIQPKVTIVPPSIVKPEVKSTVQPIQVQPAPIVSSPVGGANGLPYTSYPIAPSSSSYASSIFSTPESKTASTPSDGYAMSAYTPQVPTQPTLPIVSMMMSLSEPQLALLSYLREQGTLPKTAVRTVLTTLTEPQCQATVAELKQKAIVEEQDGRLQLTAQAKESLWFPSNKP